MEGTENSKAGDEEFIENGFGVNDKEQTIDQNRKLETNNKGISDSPMNNNKDNNQLTYSTWSAKIMSEYLSGNWENFFNIWNKSFAPHIRESFEYKLMTLNLRVHFAILPIRIVKLHQNINDDSNVSKNVQKVLQNVADKFGFVDDEKDLEDEKGKLTVDNMKQLEDFLNSCNGQKLTKELKNSSSVTFFALPYIVNPEEDESMKEIFSIKWLEKLTDDFERFIIKYFQIEYFLSQEKSEIVENHSFPKVKESNVSSSINTPSAANSPICNSINDYKSKLTENKSDVLCGKRIHSAIKNKQIEDWMARYHQNNNENTLNTRSTQTHISCVKTGTGFSLVSEPNHIASVVIPNSIATVNKPCSLYKDELNTTKSRLFSVHKHYKNLKLRFHKLHEDYQKMNEIAEELTIALENSVRGQPVNLNMILHTCMKIFPDRFNRVIQTDSEDTCLETKDYLSKNILPVNERQNILKNIPVSPASLDYKKIKLHLKCGNIKTKLLLLQALRQKLTLNQPSHRDETIHEYVNNDILKLKENLSDNDEYSILSKILQPLNSDALMNCIQQSTSRFINALASMSFGRTYLTSGPTVLNIIIKYLDSCNNRLGDSVTVDMLLATLQKMSLRKQQRKYMIEANLVEWLIYHLSNENFRMGSYRLEYTCALLMNLSLQSESRIRASEIAPLFVSTMAGLLSTDYVSILPYVNGALQNFLLNEKINEEAKKLHLAEIIEYRCLACDEELRKNFSHTLKIHKRECDENLSDDDDFPDEDDEIFDILENELEEDDPVRVDAGDLQGEYLLSKCYTVPSFTLKTKNLSHKKVVEVSNAQINDLSSSFRESKKAGLTASTIIVKSETISDDFKTETMPEKKSSTIIADSSKKGLSTNIKDDLKSQDKDEENVFLAKPKLMRTPPSSARDETNNEKLPKQRPIKTK